MALTEVLRGKGMAREEIEGVYSYLAQIGATDWRAGGFLGVYQNWQSQRDEKTEKAWRTTLDEASGWFGTILLDEIEHACDGTKTIAFVAVGMTGVFPLQAMWVPDEKQATRRRYLTDKFSVRFIPRARILLRPVIEPGNSFLAVEEPQPVDAPRIPFASAEVAIAQSLFEKKTRLRGMEATLGRIVNELEGANIVHFCCHAMTRFARPLESAILLAQNQRLTLRQFGSISLKRARLILLSACETGKINRKLPDQSITLAAGLLGAGAEAVIASAWDLDDASTCLVLLRFYHDWQISGATPLEALRLAQRWTRDTMNSEKAAFLQGLLPAFHGTGRFDTEAIKQLYQFIVLKPPEERSFAHPYYWAALSYQGQ